jgi:Flp pilus assembly protein TadD
MNGRSLRVFVAMPGTTMGPNASYQDPKAVKENLLEPAIERLQSKLGVPVDLVIEKDKLVGGVIHESMFAEARDADIYIADLTSANPNVYLELGVRWALRDKVTVIISQRLEDVKFNASANRAILYQPASLVKAQNDLVQAIEAGLTSDKPDNPVRLNSKYVMVPQTRIGELEQQIERLTKERGEDLLRAAQSAEKLSERVEILKQATAVNPASAVILLELGRTFRSLADYPQAISTLERALRLDKNDAVVHRELGVTHSKAGNPPLAAAALREAVRLAPDDAEAWSNLGGSLRRMGMSGAPQSFDVDSLKSARQAYSQAHKLKQFDLYSGLNVARLDLILSKWEPGKASEAENGFRRQVNLCRFMVDEEPSDYWRRFDLADALLFGGSKHEVEAAYDAAIQQVLPEARRDVLSSVLGPLENYVTAGVVSGQLADRVHAIINKLRAAAKAA